MLVIVWLLLCSFRLLVYMVCLITLWTYDLGSVAMFWFLFVVFSESRLCLVSIVGK